MRPAEWSAAVLARCPACWRCGSVRSLFAQHIEPEPGLRYVPENGRAVCASCRVQRYRETALPRAGKVTATGRPHYKTIARRLAAVERALAISRAEARELRAEVRRLTRSALTRPTPRR